MSGHIALFTSVVRDQRTPADIDAERAARSSCINQPHPFFTGTVLPRDIPDDERAEAQARVDAYKSRAFEDLEASEHDHWSY